MLSAFASFMLWQECWAAESANQDSGFTITTSRPNAHLLHLSLTTRFSPLVNRLLSKCPDPTFLNVNCILQVRQKKGFESGSSALWVPFAVSGAALLPRWQLPGMVSQSLVPWTGEALRVLPISQPLRPSPLCLHLPQLPTSE